MILIILKRSRFPPGDFHSVKNHFIRIHKVDQNNKWLTTSTKLPMVFSTFGVKKARPVGWPKKCKGMKEWTEGDLRSVRNERMAYGVVRC